MSATDLADAPGCPVCRGSAVGLIGVKDGLRVLRCGVCTAQFSEARPDESRLELSYGEHYFNGAGDGYPAYVADEPIHRARARRYLADVARHRRGQGRLLDVGCATGFLLDEARLMGWSVQGCEISPWAAQYARQMFGLDVVDGSFPSAALAGARADVVTFLNVFEHLPDPVAVERALRSIVRAGGIVAIETWNADALVVRLLGMRWHKYRPASTPVYFNRRSLTTLFNPRDWTLLEFLPRTKWIALEHGLHALGWRHVTPPRASGLGARLARTPVPYRLGDLVWVVFRRTSHAA